MQLQKKLAETQCIVPSLGVGANSSFHQRKKRLDVKSTWSQATHSNDCGTER